MLKLVKARLEELGYAVSESDGTALDFCRRRAENSIRNLCNIPAKCELPSELEEIVVDRICGEFLFSKRNSGKLNMSGIGASAAVKQIVEGDVSVSFAEGTSDSERLDALINRLMSCGERELVRFRRIRW